MKISQSFFDELEKTSKPRWVKEFIKGNISLQKIKSISKKLDLPLRQLDQIGVGADAAVFRGVDKGKLVSIKNYLRGISPFRDKGQTLDETVQLMKNMRGRIFPKFIKQIKGKPILIKEYVSGKPISMRRLEKISPVIERIQGVVKKRTGMEISDMQPANIIFRRDGKYKIIDWNPPSAFINYPALKP